MTQRGDIFLVTLDPAAGKEQKGTRPVLVVSPALFNKHTGTALVVPITSGGEFARAGGFAVALTGTGLLTGGVVRCDQPRILDLQSRNGKKLESVPDFIMDEVLAKLSTLLE